MKVKAAERKLTYLNAEAQDVQERIVSDKEKLEKQTSTILAERKQESDKLVAEFKSKIQPLEKEIKGLEDHILILETKEVGLIDAIQSHTEEIEQRQIQLGKINKEIEAATESRDVIIQKQDSLASVIGELKGNIYTAEESLATLKNDVAQYAEQKIDLEDQIEVINQALDLRRKNLEHEIKNLETKKAKISVELQLQQKEQEQTRRELADRHLKLEEWDKGLRIRERKAEIQEDRISQNANLLDL